MGTPFQTTGVSLALGDLDNLVRVIGTYDGVGIAKNEWWIPQPKTPTLAEMVEDANLEFETGL
jgi:hypothetical protein